MAITEPATRTAAVTRRRRFVRVRTRTIEPLRSRTALLAGVALSVVVAGCASDSNTQEATTTLEIAAEAVGIVPTSEADRSDPPGTTDGEMGTGSVELTENDVGGLLWMREEEQLAHDVYTVLGEEWGLRIFRNISASEQKHVDRVAELLDRYGIEDPMADQAAGSFTIPEMQALHDQLVADGRESIVDALEVGALIEETDIVDLRAHATDVADIQATYTQLEEGSQRHLRAFVFQLDSRDVGYEPDLLDPAAFDEIGSGT